MSPHSMSAVEEARLPPGFFVPVVQVLVKPPAPPSRFLRPALVPRMGTMETTDRDVAMRNASINHAAAAFQGKDGHSKSRRTFPAVISSICKARSAGTGREPEHH